MTKDQAVTGATLDQAARGYRATLLSHALRVTCKAAAVVVLARVVSPAEHGLFAMAASVFYVLVLFRDVGLGPAAVQARELTEEQLSTLWRAHVAIGLVLALLAAALGPPTAMFFREPRAAALLAAMSPGFLLIGLNAWPRILLARQLRFAELNRAETAAAVLGTVAMMAAGAAGAGAYAFVTFLLVSELVACIGAWVACEWRPRVSARWASLRGLWRFGANLTVYNVVSALLQQIDAMLLGRWFGPSPLGHYNRSSQLLGLPALHLTGPLTHVLLATLARLGSDTRAFRLHFKETVNLLAHLTLPFAAVCAAAPDEVIRLLLGANWPEAAPLLRWLALGAAAGFLGSAIYPLCVATGHARRLALMATGTLGLTIIALTVGRPFGPTGIAAAVATTQGVLLLPRWWWATRDTPVALADWAAAAARPFVLAVVLTLTMTATRGALPDTSWLGRLALVLGAGLAAGLLLAAMWPSLRREMHHLVQRTWMARAVPAAAAGDVTPASSMQ